uniref:hypothetical protein n=1 Tax=Pedobacter schmidteae TaxID=2201271 RepID=UPI000EB23A79|nr:hypothetical protein [Pedobacter schmidteae]
MEEGKTYIETGILEEYVAGQLTTKQQREVEVMAARYPEVKREIKAIEMVLEQYAMTHAIQPSEELKDIILAQLLSASL